MSKNNWQRRLLRNLETESHKSSFNPFTQPTEKNIHVNEDLMSIQDIKSLSKCLI